MAFGWHAPAQEVDEVLREKRIARQVVEPERLSVRDPNVLEADVEELLEKHWLRQRARQSACQCSRTLQHLLGQRLIEREIGDGNTPTRPQDAHCLRQTLGRKAKPVAELAVLS